MSSALNRPAQAKRYLYQPVEVWDTCSVIGRPPSEGKKVQTRKIPVNPDQPFEIETELFKGLAILKCRSDPLDPKMYKLVQQYPKYQFELAIQGKFKYETEGCLFLGAELCGPMTLTVLKRGMFRMMLNILARFQRGLHYVLDWPAGAKEAEIRKEGEWIDPVDPREIPHVIFPVAFALDRFIVTPPGRTPPVFGWDMFPKELSADKKDAPLEIIFQSGPTYSLSFFSQNMNLVDFDVRNVPGMKPMSLSTLFPCPLRLIAYQLLSKNIKDRTQRHGGPLPNDYYSSKETQVVKGWATKKLAASDGAHTGDRKDYVFAFEIKHIPGASTRWVTA